MTVLWSHKLLKRVRLITVMAMYWTRSTDLQYCWNVHYWEFRLRMNEHNIHNMMNVILSLLKLTRNTFCWTWYLPHSRVLKSMAELCSNVGDSAITKGQIAYFFFIAHARNGHTSTSCQKSDIIVFPDPDFLYDAEFWRYVNILGIYCVFHICMDFQDLWAKNGNF